MDSHDHFTRWCIVMAVYALFFSIAAFLGWPTYLFSLDDTPVSSVIGALTAGIFVGMSVWCGVLSWQVDLALKAQARHCADVVRTEALGFAPPKLDLSSAVRRFTNSSEHGWFAMGVCQTLGLIGTLIGFVMMLTGLKGFTVGDPSATQAMMAGMTSAMGAAFTTSIFGMTFGLMIALQYHMLDRAVGRLVKQ